jgi:hypothetical protein
LLIAFFSTFLLLRFRFSSITVVDSITIKRAVSFLLPLLAFVKLPSTLAKETIPFKVLVSAALLATTSLVSFSFLDN